MFLPTVTISARAAGRIAEGYLWIFSNEIDMKKVPLESGSWCFFVGPHGKPVTGYFNPHSLIAGRVVGFDAREDLANLLEEHFTVAFEKRRELIKKGACRLVFSEADFMPGLVVDYYSGVIVAQSNTAGMDVFLSEFKQMIPRVFQRVFGFAPSALVFRADSSIRQLEGVKNFTEIVSGENDKIRHGVFSENGIQIAADFLEGQKTGFFLDQRPNREFLYDLVRNTQIPPPASSHKGRGISILDLCCYSGAWGLYALRAGAEHVTFVDQSAEALALARRSFKFNQLPENRGKFVESDVFDFLEKETSTYHVVVADPPAFVKSKKNLPQAIKGYEKLNRLAWRRVAKGGILLTSSCSYHLPAADFLDVVRGAVGREKGAGHLVYHGWQGLDHPVLLSMPETGYLKCIGVRKLF